MNIVIWLVVLFVVLPVVLGILLKIAAFLLIRGVARAALGEVGRQAMTGQPEAIHLARAEGHVWAAPEKNAACADPLLSRHFEDAGTYGIREMPGVYVRLLVKPQEHVAAAIYEHPKAGTWMDVYSRYTNGDSCTYSSMTDRGMNKRPGATGAYLPGSDADTIYQRFMAERTAGALAQMDAGTVVGLFEDAYARDQAWRQKRGISAEEVARHIKTDPERATT